MWELSLEIIQLDMLDRMQHFTTVSTLNHIVGLMKYAKPRITLPILKAI